MNLRPVQRVMVLVGTAILCTLFSAPVAQAQTPAPAAVKKHNHKKHHTSAAAHPAVVTSNATGRTVALTTTQAGVIHTGTAATTGASGVRRHRRHVYYNPWTEPTYADSTVGDNVDGEDLIARRAGVEALGPYNGSVVIADPQTGRILTMVNQKKALTGAYQPCSTVKMVVSLASLSEGLVDSTTPVHITRRYSMDMTQALARSNNLYFAKLGQQLGFDRVEKYAKLYGLGEKAGLDISGEEAGYLDSEPPETGVGMMTSFGDGIRVTPLELASVVSTIANGGTMYYLQYPKSQEEVEKFIPRIKRQMDIANLIPEVKAGMMGAVESPFGTARRANYDPNEPIFGKTGTCTDTAQPGVHLGWFASFNEVGGKKLVVVVLLTGGRGISGPIASGVGGMVYRNLSAQHYFGVTPDPSVPTALISLPVLTH